MPIPEQIQEPLLEGKLEEAEGLLRAYLQEQPDDPDAFIELARVLLGQRRLQDAEAMISEMLEDSPEDASALGLRGLWHELSGRLTEAKDDYEASLALDPEQSSVLYNLGRLCVVSVDFDDDTAKQAEQHLQKAIELTPDHFQAYFQLAALYTRLNRPEDAVRACYQTIERNPLHIPSYLFLGEIFTLLGQVDEVIELYKAALRVNPLAHAFRDELLRLYRMQERMDAAFEIALEQSQMRGAFEDFLELGKVAIQLNQPQAAEVAFVKAEDIKPSDWRASYNLGELYRGIALWDKAIEAYNRSLEKAETPEIYTGIGLVAQQTDSPEAQEQAISCFQKALSLSPDTPEYLLNLALALQQAGRIQEINDTLTRVEPLFPSEDPTIQQVRSLLA